MAQRRMNKWNENEKWKFNLFHATKVLNGKACKAFKFQVWVESFELGMFRVSDRGSDAIRTNEIWSRSQAPMWAKDVIVLATFKRGKLKRVLVSASSWIRWRQFAARNARYHSLLIHTFCHFLSISHPQAVSCDVCMFKVVSSGTLSFSAFIEVFKQQNENVSIGKYFHRHLFISTSNKSGQAAADWFHLSLLGSRLMFMSEFAYASQLTFIPITHVFFSPPLCGFEFSLVTLFLISFLSSESGEGKNGFPAERFVRWPDSLHTQASFDSIVESK